MIPLELTYMFGTDRSCQSMKRRRELKIFFSYSLLAEAGGVRVGVGVGGV